MAGFFKKIVSGLDFWDKEENRSQRQAYAREDERERERRRQQAARQSTSRGSSAVRPGDVINPQADLGDLFSPAPKPRAVEAAVNDFSAPLKKVEAPAPKFEAKVINPTLPLTNGKVDFRKPLVKQKPKVQGQESNLETFVKSVGTISENADAGAIGLAKGVVETPSFLANSYNMAKLGLGNLTKNKVSAENARNAIANNRVANAIDKKTKPAVDYLTKQELRADKNASTLSPAQPEFAKNLVKAGVNVIPVDLGISEVSALAKSRKLSRSQKVAAEVEVGTATSNPASLTERLVDSTVRQTTAKPEAPKLPGTPDKPNPSVTPSVEVSPGVKSTNLAKPQPDLPVTPPVQPAVNVPNPANPISLAKAGNAPAGPAPSPIPNIAPAAPLQKVNEPVLPINTQRVDAQGNENLVSDVRAAEEGVLPVPGASPVATAEEAMELARREAEAAQVNQPPQGFVSSAEQLGNARNADELGAIADDPTPAFQRLAERDQADLARQREEALNVTENDVPAYMRQGKTLPDENPSVPEINDNLNNTAAQVAADPANANIIGEAFRITGGTNPLSLVMNALARTQDRGTVRRLVQQLIPGADGNVLNRTVNAVTGADDAVEVSQILTEAASGAAKIRPLGPLSDAPAPRPVDLPEPAPAAAAPPVETTPPVVTPPTTPAVAQDQVLPTEFTDAPVAAPTAPIQQTPVQATAPQPNIDQQVPNMEQGTMESPNRQFNAPESGPAEKVPRTGDPASIRERKAFAADEQDPILAKEIMDSVPKKNRVNVEESLAIARENARTQTPEGLVSKYSEGVKIDQDNPQAWVNALEERKMLSNLVRDGFPGAREARLNLANSMSEFQSKAGQNLNILKVAYDELDSDMKADLLMKKLKNVGEDERDAVRTALLSKIEVADAASARLQAIDDQIVAINKGVMKGSGTPEARTRLSELNKAREDAQIDLYEKNGKVTDYFGQESGGAAFGEKLANYNRVAMLSSATGRVFDLISTAATTALDSVNRNISALVAKPLNKVMKSGAPAKNQLAKVAPSIGDLGKAVKTTSRTARGKGQVQDVMAEINGSGTGRSELRNSSKGPFRNLVKAATEAPTEATKYIEANELRRVGLQQAKQLGLKGDDAKLYADSYNSVATTAEKYSARQEHMKANMLQNNAVSKKIDQVSRALLDSDNNLGKSGGAILKGIVAPFTRFIGGLTARTFTDMNVGHNAFKIAQGIKRGDTQAVADNVAKMTVNFGVGVASATLMVENGMLTDKDANGKSYNGLYLHAGDRYIPVGIFGLASVPMIVGYGMNKSVNAEDSAGAFSEATVNTLSRVLASTGTAGFFGASNGLQTAFSSANSAISASENKEDDAAWMKVVGDAVRQSVPALFSDINAGLNSIPSLNPTGEMAETNAVNDDGTKNPLKTQLNKFQNTIPGLSQQLDRRVGTPAKDLYDRVLKSTRETGEMAEDKSTKLSMKDLEKQYTKDKLPMTDDAIKNSIEDKEYDKAIKGYEYQIKKKEAEGNASKSDIAGIRDKITVAGMKRDGIPTDLKGIEARMEEADYPTALKGLQYQYDKIKDDDEKPQSDKDDLLEKIGKTKIYDELDTDLETVTAYDKKESKDGGIGVTAWRELAESDDPTDRAYADKLSVLDQTLLKAGIIKKAKYYYGNGGSGSGRGGGKGTRGRTAAESAALKAISGDIADNKISFDSYTPIKAQGIAMGPRQSAIPKLAKAPNNDRSKLKKISVSRGRG